MKEGAKEKAGENWVIADRRVISLHWDKWAAGASSLQRERDSEVLLDAICVCRLMFTSEDNGQTWGYQHQKARKQKDMKGEFKSRQNWFTRPKNIMANWNGFFYFVVLFSLFLKLQIRKHFCLLYWCIWKVLHDYSSPSFWPLESKSLLLYL